MTDDSQTISVGHPSPERHKTGLFALAFAMFAAPIAWNLHLVVNFGLASHACFPTRIPVDQPLPPGSAAWITLLLCDGLAIALALSAGLTGYRIWRRTSGETGGRHAHLLQIGEGRTRFLAMCGILASAGFILATLFDTIPLFLVPFCGA